MNKISIIGSGPISEALHQIVSKLSGEEEFSFMSLSPENFESVKIKPFELAEVPMPYKDDRPCLSKHRKGHHEPKLSATQWRKARQRKNKIQAKSRRKNKKQKP